MRIKLKTILLILCFLFSFLSALPAVAQLGELKINPLQGEAAARPLGMGGVFVGLADDMNAALYNPAGLAWAKGVALTVQDAANITALQAYPTGFGSGVGLAVVTEKLSGIPFAGGVAGARSESIYFSYGTKLNFIPFLYDKPLFRRLGVGINIKSLSSQTLTRTGTFDSSATGWDVDLGLLWKGSDWWSAGILVQNILPADSMGGGLFKWDSGGEEGIPLVAKLAASARIIGDIGTPIFMEGRELLVGGEVHFYREEDMLLRLGGEWNFNKLFYLRTGYMQQHGPTQVVSDINYGLGLRYDTWGMDLASYRDAAQDQRFVCLSFLYFPEAWVVLKKLDIAKPTLGLEKAIEAISLEDNIVTYDDKIDVFGRVKAGVDVYINGLRAALDSENAFKTVVPLRLGKNLVLVEARFEEEKKSWKYKVLRKAQVKIADAEKVENIEAKKEIVESLVTVGVIEITPEEDFVMEAGITRGELASWLVKAAEAKLPVVTKDLYADVPKEHPLAPYIKVISDLKLLMPFPDGTFRPGAIVSKEEGKLIFKRFGVRL